MEITSQITAPSGYPLYIADLDGNALQIIYMSTSDSSHEDSLSHESIAQIHAVGTPVIHQSADVHLPALGPAEAIFLNPEAPSEVSTLSDEDMDPLSDPSEAIPTIQRNEDVHSDAPSSYIDPDHYTDNEIWNEWMQSSLDNSEQDVSDSE